MIIADERIYVSAHKREIHRVLHNLVDNAVKFTDENGIIEVETSLPKNENKVYVSVSDSGKGVSRQ